MRKVSFYCQKHPARPASKCSLWTEDHPLNTSSAMMVCFCTFLDNSQTHFTEFHNCLLAFGLRGNIKSTTSLDWGCRTSRWWAEGFDLRQVFSEAGLKCLIESCNYVSLRFDPLDPLRTEASLFTHKCEKTLIQPIIWFGVIIETDRRTGCIIQTVY